MAGSALTELTVDHRAVGRLLGDAGLPDATDRRRDAADRLTVALVRHMAVEERYVYPLVREHLPGGDGLADRAAAAHTVLDALLRELELVPADVPRFAELWHQVTAEARAHAADEESRVFPLLSRYCAPSTLDELAHRIRAARSLVPAASADDGALVDRMRGEVVDS